ncbi:MAG: M42 family metallopeptidase [Planctomycetes bacterium]|nr:M42 family metallopeptidase [Planctomycetota bacterium]
MTPLVDRIETDGIGNMIAIKEGKGPHPRKVMLAGHMDEIGFIVRHIDDNGFLRLQPLGGFDPKTLIAKRVRIMTRGGEDLIGVIGTKPIHILGAEERKKLPELDDLFVDLGLDAVRVNQQVRVGDPVTLDQTFVSVGDFHSCKAMDNRVSIYTLIEAVRRVRDPQVSIYAVATTQEEVGLRGAVTAASRIQPDIGVAVDVTLACDVPGAKPEEHVTDLRKGTAIKIMDSSLICTPKLVDYFRHLAEKHEIPHQMEILSRGGTDAGGIQRAHEAVPSITLSVPTRYVHSVVETIYGPDLEATVELLTRFLETAHTIDLTY